MSLNKFLTLALLLIVLFTLLLQHRLIRSKKRRPVNYEEKIEEK